MTFLNLALLAGMAAIAVPLAIHLFSRRRYQLVPWGAMFLIDQVVRRHRRRVRIEQWILLAMRCCIPVLLALAMARPVLTGWRSLAGDEPVSAVVILDASYSMSAPAPGGPTAAQASREALATVLHQLPRGSEARVIVAGSGARLLEGGTARIPDPAFLDLPAPELGPAELPAAIASAAGLLDRASHRRRQVVLISDFQASSLREAPPQLPGDTELTLVQIPTTVVANAVVEDVTLSPQLPAPGRPVRVRVRLHNPGAMDLDNLSVRLFVNGRQEAESRLSISAGAVSEAAFMTRFEEAGENALEVRLSGDEFEADNRFSLVVDIPRSLGVLLVGRQPGLPFPQSPTDFLQIALEPAAGRGSEPGSALRPSAITVDELNARALAENRVVVLAGIQQLSDAQVQLLTEFVRGGGGLIVFPGERTAADFIERHALFPARLRSLRDIDTAVPAQAGEEQAPPNGAASPRASQRSSGPRLAGPPYSHRLLAPWNDPGSGRLGEATIRRWYQLEPLAGSTTVLSLDSGAPYLVEHRVGRGVVLMAAGAVDGEWSDLPLRAAFLPLVQQLVTYAATVGASPRTLWAGDAITLPIESGDIEQLVMVTPAGTRRGVTSTVDRGRTLARFADTAQPGHYQLIRTAAPGEGTAEPAVLASFALNAPRSESDLAVLSGRDLRQLATGIGAAVVGGAGGYAALEQDRRFGRETWRLVWIAVLALLFGEILLQGWFARRGATEPAPHAFRRRARNARRDISGAEGGEAAS